MKVKIAEIKETEVDNLSISWDEEDGFVLLFTPYMDNKMEHFHIELTDKEAWALEDFIHAVTHKDI
jgi:hypothetical protein